MLDKLVLQIPFSRDWVSTVQSTCRDEIDLVDDPFSRKGFFWVEVDKLPVKQGARSIQWTAAGDPVVDDLYCPWESLASSFGGLALKTYNSGNGFCPWPYLELKCSPAKLSQGHNVWGFDDLEVAFKNMVTVLYEHYPEFFGGYLGEFEKRGVMLDFDHARVAELDITYSVEVPNPQHRRSFITLMHTLSQGQTKSRGDAYETTAYFGDKKSKVRRIKVYLKGPETVNDQRDRKRKGLRLMSDEVLTAAKNLVRVEATVKREWLDRRNIPTNIHKLINWFSEDETLYRKVFGDVTKDLWRALEGQEITVIDDKKVFEAINAAHGHVRGKAARVFSSYQTVKAVGLDAIKATYPERTYRRIVKELEQAGFSRAVLGNLHSERPTIIQIAQVINLASLGDPVPQGETVTRLYAVAA